VDRDSQVILIEDVVSLLERSCLIEKALELDAGFALIFIDGGEWRSRFERYEALSPIEEEKFSECDRIERQGHSAQPGISEVLHKDWTPSTDRLRHLADIRIRNDKGIDLDTFRASGLSSLRALMAENLGTPAKRSAVEGATSVLAKPDSVERVLDLQQRWTAAEYLKSVFTRQSKSSTGDGLCAKERALSPILGPTHYVDEIGNQFMSRLVDVFLVQEGGRSLELFRRLVASTSDEEAVLLANDAEFVRYHSGLWSHLDEKEREIRQYARVEFRQVVTKLDGEQFSRRAITTGPSLTYCQLHGLKIEPNTTSLGVIRDAQIEVGEGRLPILEVLKNQRILTLNGLTNSKVSHTVHDALDHIWFFDLLQRRGILDRHGDFLTSIGNPEEFDLFSRESECVASISFGARLWANQQIGFTPIWGVQDIRSRLDEAFRRDQLEERQLPAYRTVLELSEIPFSREAQSLAFVWSNYLVELDEQRRKQGEIKQGRRGPSKVLDPWAPDYLCFFIDAHHELCNPKNKHRDNLLRVHLAIEEYLTSERVLSGEQFVLRVPRLHDTNVWDPNDTPLPHRRIEWMSRHFGFTALREPADL
jgi:hypothetical protein